MSDAKTEGGSAPSLNVPRCDVCGREKYTLEPVRSIAALKLVCWRESGAVDNGDCYRIGYERFLALINEKPRRQAPPDALAQARSEGRAAALTCPDCGGQLTLSCGSKKCVDAIFAAPPKDAP